MDNAQGRIRWKCRRGMLELDILLLNFFDNYFTTLSLEQKNIFERLLDEPDPDLYAWFLGHKKSTDAELQAMVDDIIEHNKECGNAN
ncbi:MAG: succinate dehydrogenase assembly factor 2 [Gammaproteobacteria bacterium]|nr:succinate dehydrogenase assembly factor 2 [Gammaproteobacteria bacterium]